ncbi:MAG: YfbU family protein [Acidobacteriota bacterium]
MRVDEATLERIDRWRRVQEDVPSRAEATRRLIGLGLESCATGDDDRCVRFSDGERLLMLMMRDIYKRLKVDESEIDMDFIADVIRGGHYWAPKWQMQGVFHGEEDDPRNVSFVVEVLNMWSFLERAHRRMGEKVRERIKEDANLLGVDVRFEGFDGNNEGQLMGIADFLINKMGRFEEFRKRDLNSHFPSVDMYTRMLAVFKPMEKSLCGKDLSATDIVRILKARAERSEATDDARKTAQ